MAVVDGCPGTIGLGQCGFLCRTHGTDQLHAQRLGPLAGQGADTPRSGVEQDGFATLEIIGLAQQVLHGQALEHHSGSLFESDGVRQAHQVGFGQHVNLAVSAQRAAAISHAIADLEPGHFAADRVDHARAFRTQTRWQGRWRVEAAAVIGVDEVQADGLVGHAHLLRAGLGGLVVHILKYFRAAMGTELDTLCHLHSPEIVLPSALSGAEA
ncbi:hypothetical protein D3C78_525020 [compost metagenome]